MTDKNDLEELLKLLQASDEKQIQRILKHSKNPHLKKILDLLKIFKLKDIEEIAPLFRKALHDSRSQIKNRSPENVITHLEELQTRLSLFEPVFISGKINKKSVVGLLPKEEELVHELEIRISIHNKVKSIYEQSFKQHLMQLQFSDAILKKASNFERGIVEFLEDFFKLSIKSLEDISAMDWVTLFHKLFSFLEQLLTFFALGLKDQIKGPKVKEKSFHSVLDYLASINEQFKEVFDDSVSKVFRDKDAHDLFRRIDDSNIYYLREDNKKIPYTKEGVKKAYLDLTMYFLSIFDQFFMAPVREHLLTAKSLTQDYMLSEMDFTGKINGWTSLILLPEPSPNIGKEDWIKIFQNVRDFCLNQSKKVPLSALLSHLRKAKAEGMLDYPTKVLRRALDKLIEIGFLKKNDDSSLSLAIDPGASYEPYLEKAIPPRPDTSTRFSEE